MSKFELAIPSRTLQAWPGLGHWNLYFILKFALQWGGYLNVQLLSNLLFAAFLLVPLNRAFMVVARRLVAVPMAVALFYRDTWLPPLDRWLEQPQAADFSSGYLLKLAESVIDWNLCGWLLVLVVVYQFVHPWLRLTTLTLAGLAWLGYSSLMAPLPGQESGAARDPSAGYTISRAGTAVDNYLKQFNSAEADRRVVFTPSAGVAQPFDVVLLNVDSLAWDDLDVIELRDHPLLRQMDVLFDRFNTAASERVPAALRLLRAGCGQAPRRQLYAPAAESCRLFGELGKQGFAVETLLNHTGQFEGFLDAVQTLGLLPAPRIDLSRLQPMLAGPDGSPVLRDREVLNLWWNYRQEQPDSPVALFYNSLSLHSGNRVVTAEGEARRVAYKTRAQALLDDLSGFLEQLELSGRRVVVVLVPQRGAALRGDRMQFPGMHEIPSPSITQVPVGIKLIGMGRNSRSAPLHIGEPSSYLALAQIIERLYAASIGDNPSPEWQPLLAGLAQTPWVSESESSVVLNHTTTSYVRIKEKGAWLPYQPISK
ncbi:cellulose biosynthesis protein BcsG [Pseudomonas sp. CFBP 5748]